VTSKFTLLSSLRLWLVCPVTSYRRFVLGLATAVAVVAGGGAYVVQQRDPAPPAARPGASATPTGSPLPTVAPVAERTPAAYASPPASGAEALPEAVARALAAPFADEALGARVNAMVADAATGATLYDRNAHAGVVPASTTKLFTAVAALRALGPDRRLPTRIVTAGTVASGTLTGDLVVVGGGDPTLTDNAGVSPYPQPARLADLARQVRAKGITRVTGRVVVDASLFGGARLGPGWKPTYVTEGSVAPVTAFEVDGGRPRHDASDARVQRPDLTGGAKLAAALRRAGVAVGTTVTTGGAPATATELALVESPPVSALVERLLIRSDNDLAEALARHVAIERRLTPDFAGAAQAVTDVLRDLGVDPPVLYDASGLSRLDRIAPAQMVAVLATATREQSLAPVIAGLPVAAFTGTLASRYTKAPATAAAGRVRAKTGSLDNVATLAGVVETASGRVLVFAFAADRLPTRFVGAAARALDVAATALARCGCAA
jgi:D-alanyl-D-alanine carboxypeptidase/D-alanyl-D-alanine-endopeptidase (penicillin-binding protein 4)